MRYLWFVPIIPVLLFVCVSTATGEENSVSLNSSEGDITLDGDVVQVLHFICERLGVSDDRRTFYNSYCLRKNAIPEQDRTEVIISRRGVYYYVRFTLRGVSLRDLRGCGTEFVVDMLRGTLEINSCK